MPTELTVKPVVRLLKKNLTVDWYKAKFSINLWSPVQHKVFQLPFFSGAQVTVDKNTGTIN